MTEMLKDDPHGEIVPLSTQACENNGREDQKMTDIPEKKQKTQANPNKHGVLAAAGFIAVFIGIIVSAVFWSNIQSSTEASPTPHLVKTPAGVITGTAISKEGNVIVAYKAIPFAKPPVGKLRFKRPQPLDSPRDRGEPINTDEYKKSCWSATKSSTSKYYGEDCLYLNVYVPEGTTEPLPVMVWLHGGGFVAGSTFPEPWKMVHQGHVVVVTVNYRLGVFGFMTTLDGDFPSNNGLWDQSMAIKWVRDNIQHLHGDPNSITVFGESAGASSSALHVISPVSSKHFHKVILQSGSMTTTVSRHSQRAVERFAELVGCITPSGVLLKSCLQNVSVDDILKYSKPEWYVTNRAQRQINFVWMPVIDGEFIPDEPLKLLNNVTFLEEQGAFQKDYMIGVVNDEGALLTTNFFYPIPVSDLSNETFFSDLQLYLLENRYGKEFQLDSAVSEAINTFYTGRAVLNSSPNYKAVLDFAADLAFVLPAVETAVAVSNKAVRRSSKTFLFQFDHCPPTDESQAPCFGHGDIVALMFPRKNITLPVDAQLSDRLISLLTRFAKDSNPGAGLGRGWPEFEPDRRQYLRLSSDSDLRSDLYRYRMQFWLTTMPCILHGGLYCS